ncbi:probable G-protein coupled receptor CG31760, partial [Diadema antillarum]|uniref:probable G-protein coupled receptor CG31760 n=1 Tax=Diadema antillarum TaxID=105358 RepID=UPI003A87A493
MTAVYCTSIRGRRCAIGYRFGGRPSHETYRDLAKRYGPVFSLRRGPYLAVVLNDKLSIRQALLKNGEVFSDRFVPKYILEGIPGKNKSYLCHLCTHISGLGFQRGAYRCECKPGYYFPVNDVPTYLLDVDSEDHRAFSGSAIEAEYNKKVYGEDNLYDSAFDCFPCLDGCEDCVDASPCFAEPNVVLRWSLLAVNTLGMVMLLVLAFYTYRLRENRVFKAASPGLLYVILVGTGICYCQTIAAVVLSLNIITCQVLNWCRYIGFCLAYGALLYKTWRITKVFTVRSAKPVRITDNNLYARIGILLAVCAVYLSAWTFLDPSTPTLEYKEDGLKFYECSRNTWDYVGQG